MAQRGLRENLVHLLTHMLAARWFQVAHRALHVGMAEPLLNGAQIELRSMCPVLAAYLLTR